MYQRIFDFSEGGGVGIAISAGMLWYFQFQLLLPDYTEFP